MFGFLTPARRRAEEQRVQQFLYAIRESALDFDETIQWPAAQRTDTTAFPRIILAGTVIGAAVVLSGCGSQAPTPVDPSEAPHVVQTVAPEPPALWQPGELTGTDAGLITTPAPSAYELESADRDGGAESRVHPTTVPAPVVTAVPTPVVPQLPAPVVVEEPAGHQSPDEVIGSYRCEDVTMIVVAVNADGSWDCQVPA
jgi:hypothetical protein